MSLRKIAILVIIPDIQSQHDIDTWDKCVENAYELYNLYPTKEEKDISTVQRWAIGFVAWKKLIDYLEMSNVNVYFIRTDFRLKDKLYTIDNDIVNIKFDYNHGHIIYKTLVTLNILQKDNYDFFVRGNVNTIIDINSLSQLSQTLPSSNVFTSPFFEGNSYPYGYFIMISKDIADYLVNLKLMPDNRWFNEATADDYELTEVILKKFNYYILDGCEIPLSHDKIQAESRQTINKYGITPRGNKSETSEFTINKIKNSSHTIFLYRIKEISDHKYVDIYKSLIKHIWNKVVSCKFNNLIYNEQNYLVPREYERDEQLLVARYIDKNDIVLELGARYGSVSCIINKILVNKKNQVSVEPDTTVLAVLEKNKEINNCEFHIYKGIISSNKCYNKLIMFGYGSTVDINNSLTADIYKNSIDIECISLEDLQKKFGLSFDTLVADCEGFLEVFLNENKILYTQLKKIIFECDRPDVCNYNNIKRDLIEHNFKMIENGFQCVFIK
jgi:FkbM family methyltransferase